MLKQIKQEVILMVTLGLHYFLFLFFLCWHWTSHSQEEGHRVRTTLIKCESPVSSPLSRMAQLDSRVLLFHHFVISFLLMQLSAGKAVKMFPSFLFCLGSCIGSLTAPKTYFCRKSCLNFCLLQNSSALCLWLVLTGLLSVQNLQKKNSLFLAELLFFLFKFNSRSY